MVNDPVADFLTRLRNGLLARKKVIVTQCSKMTHRIAEILHDAGYIDSFKVDRIGAAKVMHVTLRYDAEGKAMAEGLKRVSKPGLRAYCKAEEIPMIRNGMGLSILSTSKGIMTGEHARKNNVGGEVLCIVY